MSPQYQRGQGMNLPNLIIGGTNKAGTTSVFRYLSDHPQVCGSSVKETGFFVHQYTGNFDQDSQTLGSYFAHCTNCEKIRVEASTGYLALGEEAIPRIKRLLGDPRILFILRNPVERIYSYYNFHSAQLNIPQSISFEKYLDLCSLYDSGKIKMGEVPFDEWHLKALSFGSYSGFLNNYIDAFPAGCIKVMLFDDLKVDPASFMKAVCDFSAIDPALFDGYDFEKSNVTYSSKSHGLHRVARMVNRKLERILRQRPSLKSRLVNIYKRLNMAQQGYCEMSPQAGALLKQYYAESNRELEKTLGYTLPPGWQ
jgi:hypothetical protein